MAKISDAINKVSNSEIKGLAKSTFSSKTKEENRTARLQSMVTPSEKEAIRNKSGYQSDKRLCTRTNNKRFISGLTLLCNHAVKDKQTPKKHLT